MSGATAYITTTARVDFLHTPPPHTNQPYTELAAHKKHIYYLIDAADLPVSLQRRLHEHLYQNLSKLLRCQLTVSFIITRSDILMASKRQVSSLMTYIKKSIKDALPGDERVESTVDRIHVISTRNGWGFGKVEGDIRSRTGAYGLLGG